MAWIVEKTGEVRKGKHGEYLSNDAGDFIHIQGNGTLYEYPILKVTEVIELDPYPDVDGFRYRTLKEGVRAFRPISPEPEYHRVDDWM